eukprot:g2949.t1
MYAQVAQNEKGAALVGSVKEKFGGVFKFLFFTCATIVTFSGVLSIVVAATNFRPAFDFVNYVFLTLFGLIMLVVDAPYDSPGLRSFRMAVFWYGLFMTRFVGRGVCNLEAVRKKIVEQGPDQWGAYIPPNGMSKIQFRDLAASLQAITFTEEELHYIVAAMSVDVRSDGLISREEFEDWVRGPDMLVL